LFAAAIAAIVTAGIWVPLEASIDRPAAGAALTFPKVADANGWSPAAAGLADWKPRYEGYAAESRQAFSKDGRDVGLYIAYYPHQGKGRELVTSVNQLVVPEDWKWKQMGGGSDSVAWMGRTERVDRADLSGQTVPLRVFRLYWVAGSVTSSPYAAKALQAWSKLTGRGDDAALIVIYAARRSRDDDPTPSLKAFAQQMSPSIERALAGARERRG
jgi:EpsI family protein